MLLKTCVFNILNSEEITEDFITKTKKKLADLEDRSRRNNLRFDGIQEGTNETWEESESVVTLLERNVMD